MLKSTEVEDTGRFRAAGLGEVADSSSSCSSRINVKDSGLGPPAAGLGRATALFGGGINSGDMLGAALRGGGSFSSLAGAPIEILFLLVLGVASVSKWNEVDASSDAEQDLL